MEIIGENVKIKKIAITGIIASGKSTVCDILATKGAYVINTDNLIHNLYSKSEEIQTEVTKEFGEGILSSGQIDRKKLARVVFSDKEALKKLESIVHPAAIKMIKETYETVKNNDKYKAFVVEFPLLFEIGFNDWFDETVVVACDENECEVRFDERFGKGSFRQRMARLLSQDEIKSKADVIIENQGSTQKLEDTLNAWVL